MVNDRACNDTTLFTQSDSYNNTLKLGTTYAEHLIYFVYLVLQC
jgi:hypothetical protein